MDSERASGSIAKGSATTRRTVGGRTDGTIARISDAAAKAQQRTKQRMVAKGGAAIKAVR